MKKNVLVPMCFGLVFTIFSCNSGTDSASQAKAENEEKIDSTRTNEMSADSAQAMPSKDDAEFMVKAADGGMTEVELGTLAAANASASAVKDFAAMMVKDHTAGGEKLKALAATKNITLPAAISDDHQKEKEKLQSKKGKDFDKAYVDLMVEDHEKDVKEYEQIAEKTTDTELKNLATATLPMLKHHLETIKKIQDGMKK